MSTPWILDTDPGIDDALALFYLLGEASVEIVGLTTVFGNVDLTKEDDSLAQKPGINVKGPFSPAGLLNHNGDHLSISRVEQS